MSLASDGAAVMGTSHRQAPVKELVGRVREGMAQLFGLPEGYEVLLGNGGTTALWDALAFGVVRERAHHLAYGEFSSKFAKVTAGAPFLADPVVTEADPGDAPEPAAAEGCDVVAWAHNETSTGVMVPVDAPGRRRARARRRHLRRRRPAPGRRTRPTSTTSRPRSRCAADGGLWLAALSPAAIERIEEIGASGRWIPEFLSLTTALENSRKDQTYNTPAVATLWLLAEQVDWMNAGRRPRGLLRRAHAGVVRPPLRLGRGVGVRDAVRGRSGEPLAGGRARSTSTTRSTPPPWPPRCAPTASSTPSPTASSAATSCGSACSPPSSRTTSRRSPPASTTSWSAGA